MKKAQVQMQARQALNRFMIALFQGKELHDATTKKWMINDVVFKSDWCVCVLASSEGEAGSSYLAQYFFDDLPPPPSLQSGATLDLVTVPCLTHENIRFILT
jgi:hypothetical protein